MFIHVRLDGVVSLRRLQIIGHGSVVYVYSVTLNKL